MDFHKLARRDLQSLCKKNQIPANVTNIAMANALASLPHVEGLDEFLIPPEHDVTQSPETEKPPTSVITRSMTRASSRRTALEPETEQLPSRTTGRLTIQNRNAAAAADDKERRVLNFTETPAVLRTKKRTESTLVQHKAVKEKVEGKTNEEGDVLTDGTVNTVAETRQGKTQASATQSTILYTRRSTRLLEKKMNDLKLSDEVTRILEPIKMCDLAAEKDSTEDLEHAMKDEHPSESVKEDPKAEVVASEIREMSETKAAEYEVDAIPVEVESEGNIPDSQLIANVQGKKSEEFVEEAEAENEIYDNSVGENVANEVEAPVEVLPEIYGKKKSISVEYDVDAPIEAENDSKTQNSQVIANIQDEKIDKVDESLVGSLQEGLTSVEEAADKYGSVELTVHVAPVKGDGIAELNVQVTSLSLNCLKDDCNKDTDSGEVENTAVSGYNGVVPDGYLADSDAVSESTMKVKSPNGDGELEIHSDALSEQPNNPVTVKMEVCNNIGQLFDADVTEAELAMESPQNQKSVENVDLQIVSAGDSEVKLPEDVFSTKTPASIKNTSKVPLTPLSVGSLTELLNPLKSSSKKMPLKDENKENFGEGVEFGKIITGLPVTDEDIQEPTPPSKKSLRKLKKLIKEKIQTRNEKRAALQMLPENNCMAVAGEKDD